ncbi:MAG: hypothetical protein ACLUEQ_12860, partial [Cloacibacillus evryensis]
HAGDADSEGHLLIDAILHYFKFKGEVRRLLITDLNASAIQKAMGEMRSNLDYKNLSSSAEARHRADWIFGFNLTRLFTCTTERDRGEIVSVGTRRPRCARGKPRPADRKLHLQALLRRQGAQRHQERRVYRLMEAEGRPGGA